MIVNAINEGWEVIYHRAHALLAAQLGGFWKKSEYPIRYNETLGALTHHDDLEKEWEEENELTDKGAPIDFTLKEIDSKASLDDWKKHIHESLYRGRWVTYLTSMHFVNINAVQCKKDFLLNTFAEEQKSYQQQLLEMMNIEESDGRRAYHFFNWCDSLSLILCKNQIPDDGRMLQVSHVSDNNIHFVKKSSDEFVTVIPWPFEDDIFKVCIDSIHLSKVLFNSNDMLRNELKKAPINQKEWIFKRE
jgi:hypothetical protein